MRGKPHSPAYFGSLQVHIPWCTWREPKLSTIFTFLISHDTPLGSFSNPSALLSSSHSNLLPLPGRHLEIMSSFLHSPTCQHFKTLLKFCLLGKTSQSESLPSLGSSYCHLHFCFSISQRLLLLIGRSSVCVDQLGYEPLRG